jgi:uncharacterized membrane protein
MFPFLAARSLAVAALLPGLALLACRLRWRRGWLLFLGGGLTLFGVGGLLPPEPWAPWALAAAGVVLVGLAAALILGAFWSRALAWSAAGLGVAAAGSLAARLAADGLGGAAQTLAAVQFAEPAWFWLLLLIPLVWAVAWRSLDLPTPTPAERRLLLFRALPWMLVPPVGLVYLAAVLVGMFRRARFESARPWIAAGLRTLLIVVLAAALAEPRLPLEDDTMTVLFVVDRSLSVPEELGPDPSNPGESVDLRARRVVRFLNESVERHAQQTRRRDRAGLVVFGGLPRTELPPSDAPRFNLQKLPPAIDPGHTDLAAGLRLALASFPKGGGKRIVLISDGNENWGDAEEQARRARAVRAQIDVLPLAALRRNEEEILIERVEAPRLSDRGAPVPVKVLVRSFYPGVVLARLTLTQSSEGDLDARLKLDADRTLGLEVGPIDRQPPVPGVVVVKVQDGSPAAAVALGPGDEITQVNGKPIAGPKAFRDALRERQPGDEVRLTLRSNHQTARDVEVPRGLTTFYFRRPATEENFSYTYQADLKPTGIKGEKNPPRGRVLPGDREQNNHAAVHVLARGQRSVLLLYGEDSDLSVLSGLLKKAGDEKKFRVKTAPVSWLKGGGDDARDLMLRLGDYGCVVLADVASDEVDEEHQKALQDYVRSQGGGLVMIGGPKGYGAGGWQNTPVEEALPVDCDVKALKVQAKGGLVLIMHASEIAEGNFWQKKIAKLAIERLGAGDEIGVLHWNGGDVWHIPLQEVGPNRAKLLAQVDTLMPGDMPSFDAALGMAHAALTDPNKRISNKHVIIISDGDPQFTKAALQPLIDDHIRAATVGVATHGPQEDARMAAIAEATGGKHYPVKDPKQLPAIYIKETRMVSRSFLHKGDFRPELAFSGGPARDLRDPLPELGGFVRTSPKPDPQVQVPVRSPEIDAQHFPLVAYWRYGLGKAVAFTSDAGDPLFWSRRWYREGVYGPFWEQAIDWAMRPAESRRLTVTADHADGKVRVVVEARLGEEKTAKPDTNLQLRGDFAGPGGRGREADRGSRLKFAATAAGRYEAEFRAEEAGTYIVNVQPFRVVQEQGADGRKRPVEEALDGVRAAVTVPDAEFAEMETNRGLLERLRAITGGAAYEDDDQALAAAARLWARLRGQVVPEGVGSEAPDRLRPRPATASRRFEAGPAGGAAPPMADAGAPPPAAPAAGAAPAPDAPAEDFAERMARAKRRAQEQRKKDKP